MAKTVGVVVISRGKTWKKKRRAKHGRLRHPNRYRKSVWRRRSRCQRWKRWKVPGKHEITGSTRLGAGEERFRDDKCHRVRGDRICIGALGRKRGVVPSLCLGREWLVKGKQTQWVPNMLLRSSVRKEGRQKNSQSVTKGQRGHAKLYLQTDPSQGLLMHIFNYKLVLSTWVARL